MSWTYAITLQNANGDIQQVPLGFGPSGNFDASATHAGSDANVDAFASALESAFQTYFPHVDDTAGDVTWSVVSARFDRTAV